METANTKNAEKNIYTHTDAKMKREYAIAKKSGWIWYSVGVFAKNGSRGKEMRMTTIKLLDARRALNHKCMELFNNEKIADAIYRYLCDGIEECEDAEPERKKGKWIKHEDRAGWYCSECNEDNYFAYVWDNDTGEYVFQDHYCPNCGADMRGEGDG